MKIIYVLVSGRYFDDQYWVIKGFQYMTGLEDYINDNYKCILNQERFDKYGEYLWEDALNKKWYKVIETEYIE